MIITENFKSKLRQAQKMGYENVYAVIGAYKATTYVRISEIEWLLNQPNGTVLRTQKGGRWYGTPNTRHLDYSKDIIHVFKRF